MSARLFKRNLLKCGQEISVLSRDLIESDFESSQPDYVFTEIDTPLAIVKTRDGVSDGSQLFSGINVDPRTTHVFCVEYTVGLSAVEYQNHFIDLKNKRFKVIRVSNIDEKDQVLVIQATNRGDSSKEAAEA